MPETYRAFIALALSDELRRHLGGIQRCLSAKGIRARWVRPESMHLTLKFLGELPLDKMAAVTEVLDQVAGQCAPLQLTAAGLGGFPSRSRPRVLWLGIGGEREGLVSMQQHIEAGLAPLGWLPEKRPYAGHLTLARAKGRGSLEKGTGDLLTQCEPGDALAFRADNLALYRSRLLPEGAVHDILKQWTLKTPGP